MQIKTLVSTLLVAAGVAQAQKIIPVLVGSNANGTTGTIFSPDKVTAPVGSIVQFQFMGGNHTVTQSTFDRPCVPISSVNSSATGFHSGYVPAAASRSQGNIAVFNIQINDTRPLWLYCAQGRHCQSGMTMVINEK
jgi:plastocyanin